MLIALNYIVGAGPQMTIIFIILILLSKLLFKRNHFLVFLLLIEVVIIRVFAGIIFILGGTLVG